MYTVFVPVTLILTLTLTDGDGQPQALRTAQVAQTAKSPSLIKVMGTKTVYMCPTGPTKITCIVMQL